ncbi:hypothetical protein ACQCX2_12450 [Propionibacteriaceae bacterium Y1700]|uniref:hypothetical protein n=1 Tax=Microlunatus sp. Y1700 TaxID=3418487 RepID=UPI003DA767E9
MNRFRSLNWILVLALGLLALIRPVVNIIEDQLGVDNGPAVPVVLTVLITVIWIAVVGLGGQRHPVLTLACAGVTYAVLAITLSGILSPILGGELQGPLADPIAILPMLITNLVWGMAAGALALVVQRGRGVGPEAGASR